MKKYLIIGLVLLTGTKISAQVLAHNEVTTNSPSSISPVVLPNVSGALERQSYSVVYTKDHKNNLFEVTSPKTEKAEVKLVSAEGNDICTIHKGELRQGKNVFTLRHRSIGTGVYYVISKLASGEQFADRIVVTK